MKIKMTTTYNEKIMNFDIANGHEAFVNMFEEDEIAEMRDWLEEEFNADFSWAPEKELADLVAIEYVHRWLRRNLKDGILFGTEQLYNIIMRCPKK